MRGSLLSGIVLGSLAAQAAGRRPRGSCRSLVTVTETFTVTSLPEPTATPSSKTPISVTTSKVSSSSASRKPIDKPSTTVEATPSSSSQPSSASSRPSSSSLAPSSTSSSPYAGATQVDVRVPPTRQCGAADRVHFGAEAPWTLSNNMYNAARMTGTQCTDFVRALEAAGGQRVVEWTSTTDVERGDDAAAGVCKGYSNFGDGPGPKRRLRDIKAIPAYFKWSRTISGEFKGAHVFDLMVSPEYGAGEKPGTTELMLFLKTWGDQRPMGWAEGAVDTLALYGRTWTLYHGVHASSGQDVYTLEPDAPFDGVFEGDLRQWVDALAARGFVSTGDYLNHWTGGVEVYYGRSRLEATSNLSLVV